MSAKQSGATPWTRADWIAATVITLTACALRLAWLARPEGFIFDEYFYAREACWYLSHSVSSCGAIHIVVHPPLAKWLIAVGIATFGYNPIGWRAASVLAGTVTVALVYVLARRILRCTTGASVAAGLLAIDFLHFVHSRVAMLDIFVTLFAVAALLFCIYDRDWGTARPPQGPMTVLGRPWRAAAGLAAGAAVASKWPGVFALFAVLFLTLTWLVTARRSDGSGRVLARILREDGVSIVLWLVLLPAAVYVASYAGIVSGSIATAPWSEGSWLRAVGREQLAIVHYHSGIFKSLQGQSPPWMWILGKEPLIYFLAFEETTASAIVAFGSPFVWWLSIPALAYVAARLVRRRDVRAAEATITVGAFFSYAPWFMVTHVRGLYLFHFLPTVIFLCLALGYSISAIPQPPRRTAVAIAIMTGALFFFFTVHPLLVGTPRPQTASGIFGSPLHNCDVLQNFVVPETLKPHSC